MTVALKERAIAALAGAPLEVQKAFIKQMSFLAHNLQHPGLHAKKYDEANDRWQARVNKDWRFYFKILGDLTSSRISFLTRSRSKRLAQIERCGTP